MPRRPRHGLADRLRAQEQRSTTNRTITLDDGTTVTVPGRACIDVPAEALAILRARGEGVEPPEPSGLLRLLARATDPGDAMIWGAAVQFARLALDAPDHGGADG